MLSTRSRHRFRASLDNAVGATVEGFVSVACGGGMSSQPLWQASHQHTRSPQLSKSVEQPHRGHPPVLSLLSGVADTKGMLSCACSCCLLQCLFRRQALRCVEQSV